MKNLETCRALRARATAIIVLRVARAWLGDYGGDVWRQELALQFCKASGFGAAGTADVVSLVAEVTEDEICESAF